jgi:hypothetical protein
LPVLVAVLALAFGPWGLLLGLVYPMQALRLVLRADGNWRMRCSRGVFLVIGKFAEAQGALRYARLALFDRRGGLIEYK